MKGKNILKKQTSTKKISKQKKYMAVKKPYIGKVTNNKVVEVKQEIVPKKGGMVVLAVLLLVVFIVLISTCIVASHLLALNAITDFDKKEALAFCILGCFLLIPFAFLSYQCISEIKDYRNVKKSKKTVDEKVK